VGGEKILSTALLPPNTTDAAVAEVAVADNAMRVRCATQQSSPSAHRMEKAQRQSLTSS